MAKYIDKSGNVVDESGRVIQTASQYSAAQKAAQEKGVSLPKLGAYTGGSSSGQSTSKPQSSGQTPEQIAMAEKAARELGYGSLGDAQKEYGASTSLPSLDEVQEGARSLSDVTKDAYNLDLPDKPKSHLVEFADTLSRATDLAKRRRVEQQTGILFDKGFAPGQVMPATMANITQLLERNSSNFVGDRVEAAEQAYRDTYETSINERNSIRDLALKLVENGVSQEAINGVLQAPSLDVAISVASGILKTKEKDGEIKQVGSSLVRINPDGQVEVIYGGEDKPSGTTSIQEYEYAKSQGYTGSYIQYQNEDANRKAKATGGGAIPAEKKVSSGGLTVTQGDLGELSTILQASRGQDGYVDPNVYMNAYDKWVSNGGLPGDFVKYFPPAQYLNPGVDPAVLGRAVPDFILKEVRPKGSTSFDMSKINAALED